MDARYAAAYRELYARHWWWRARERILLRRIRALLANVPIARILDVGCGAGLLFDALEPMGHVEGIEADASIAADSGRWRSRIRIGELDHQFQPAAPYDVILMLDVLEHTREPEQLLERAASLLTGNGRILVTVPAFEWLWTAHDDLNHHVARYTAGEVRTLLLHAGLVPVESAYLFQSLVAAKLVARATEAVTARTPRLPAIPPPLVNTLAEWWFRAEHAIAGRLPFGTSVLAIAAPARSTIV